MQIENPFDEPLQIDRNDVLTSSDSGQYTRYRSQQNYCADPSGSLALDTNVLQSVEGKCSGQGDTTDGLDDYSFGPAMPPLCCP